MVQITLVSNDPRVKDIVSEATTVREILEKHDKNYAVAQVAIDSVPLQMGQMDMPIGELIGGAERCIISCMANKDNGAQAVIVGSSCVVKSTLTPDEIKKMKKLHPEALTMVDEDGEPVFAIDIDERTPGSINSFGACFGNATSSDGKATITVLLEPTAENPDDLVYDKLGKALSNLDMMENELREMLPELHEEERRVRAMITRM